MSALVIRADAGAQVGSGHVMRCLALAQAWQATGGQAIFAVTSGAEALLPRLKSEGMEAATLVAEPGSDEDARATSTLAREKAAAWAVMDGYCFGADYQKLIKDAGLSLLFVDDNGHAGYYCADLVLNQNLHAREEMYRPRAPETKLLLGPRYALLRREFLKWRGRKPKVPDVARRLLITLGGFDPDNMTLEVLRAVGQFASSGWEVKVVVGPGFPHRAPLHAEAERATPKIEILECADMLECMAWAQLAISSAGSTSWELCFLGIPSLLVVVAENQRPIAEELARHGAAVNLGWRNHATQENLKPAVEELALDPKRRAEMCERAQALVDGGGAMRVAMELCGAQLKLRPVQAEDRKLLWKWANDPQARASSFSTEPIPWEEHIEWFAKKIADPKCLMFIGTDDSGVPVGQVRFDLLVDSEAVVHVSVEAGQRGRGYGRELVLHGVRQMRQLTATHCVHAYIKPENRASVRAFEQAGFHHMGTKQLRGEQALHYVCEIV